MKKGFTYIIFSLLFFILFYGCEMELELDESLPIDEKIDKLYEPITMFGNPGAIAIGIIQNGERSFYGYGDAGLGFGAPKSNTIFEIGSNTKTYVATILSELINEGLLSLDDSINKFFPANVTPPTFNGQQITLRHLVTHTSGLPREVYNFDVDFDILWSEFTNEDYHTFLNDISVQAYPFDDYTNGNNLMYLGTAFRYSNIGVAILGRILEIASGKTFEELLDEHICSVLDMPDTKVYNDLTAEQKSRIPKAYNINQYEQELPRDMGRLLGPGAILSTIDDMLNYMEANFDESSPLYNTMSKCHKIIYTNKEICEEEGDFDEMFPYPEADGIGMIWYISIENGDTIIQHGGDLNHHCMFKFNKTKKAGIVTFMNTESIKARKLNDTVFSWITK